MEYTGDHRDSVQSLTFEDVLLRTIDYHEKLKFFGARLVQQGFAVATLHPEFLKLAVDVHRIRELNRAAIRSLNVTRNNRGGCCFPAEGEEYPLQPRTEFIRLADTVEKRINMLSAVIV